MPLEPNTLAQYKIKKLLKIKEENYIYIIYIYARYKIKELLKIKEEELQNNYCKKLGIRE